MPYMTPAFPDTRPLPLTALFEEQAQLLTRANALVLGVLADTKAPPVRSAGEDPWATPDPRRSHRVIAIDGARGFGKTSLLLTLLEGWRAGRTGDWTTLDPGGVADRKAYEEVGARVRALPPLDFDPVPNEIPLLCAVVSALLPVVDASVGLGEGGVRKEWQQLFQAAAVGWGGARVRGGGHDLLDAVLDLESQARDWIGIRRRWGRFIDALFAALPLESKGVELLVIPIDDIDMQTSRVSEVFHVIQLLHHPRVLFLLTADLDHAEDLARFELLGGMIRSGGGADAVSSAANVLRRGPEDWADVIAISRMEKAIPIPNRLAATGVPVWEALGAPSLMERLQAEAISTSYRTPLFPFANLADFMRSWPWLKELPPLRVRTLVQLAASPPRPARDGWPPAVSDLLDLIDDADPGSTDESPVRARDRAARVIEGAGAFLVFGEGPQYVVPNDEGRKDDASPGQLLLADLAAAFNEPRSDFLIGEHLVWSVWRSGDVAGIFRWQLPVLPRSPVELYTLHTLWSQVQPELETTVQGVAYRWVFLILATLGVDLGAPGLTSPGMAEWHAILDKLWTEVRRRNAVAKSVGTADRQTYLLNLVAHRHLPGLAAPEYGLDPWIRALILGRARAEVEIGGSPVDFWAATMNHDRRRLAASAASQYRAAQGRMAPLSLIAGPPAAALNDLDAEGLLQALGRSSDGLWEAVVTARPWMDPENPRLEGFYSALRGVQVVDRSQVSVDQAGWLRKATSPWLIDALDSLARSTQLLDFGRALNKLSIAGTGGPAPVAVGLFRAAVNAVMERVGIEGQHMALIGWFRADGSASDSMPMMTAHAAPRDDWLGVTREDGLVRESPRARLEWTIEPFPALPGPLREGLIAALLVTQTILVDGGQAFDEVQVAPWVQVLASGLTLRMPLARAWVDQDLLLRRVRLLDHLFGQLPAEIPPTEAAEWHRQAVLRGVLDCVKRHRVQPSGRFSRPDALTASNLRSEATALASSSPAFKLWWGGNETEFFPEPNNPGRA